MIGILSNRLATRFLDRLGLSYKFIDESDFQNKTDFDGLFIDWVSKIPDNEVAWMKQATLLQGYIKDNIPIVIFDREYSLKEKEVNWCKKFNTYLFEPYLNSGRSGFTYMPEWMDELEILFDDEDRKFDVVYSHHNLEYQLKGFEKWIQSYAMLFHDKKVAYGAYKLSSFKREQFKKDGIIRRNHYPLFSEGKITIALDTENSYNMGYMDPMHLYSMKYGCLPLLPTEHRYFHGMFKGLVISNMNDMDYFVSSMSMVKDVLIEEIFDRIKNEWNEFTSDHSLDMIKRCYE